MEDSANLIRIIQLSDCHLLGDAAARVKGWDTHTLLRQTLAHLALNHGDADALLLTGDLSQDESLQSYRHLQEYLKPLGIPAYALAGNHDHPALMQAVFNGEGISCTKAFSAGTWQVLLVNSALDGEVAGYITESEQQWLESQLLDNPHTPTLIATHHPAVNTGSRWLDTLGIKNADALLRIIDQHPQIKAVLSGHIHQELTVERNGVFYLATPSTCFQFKPASDEFALDDRAPAYRWLELLPHGLFNTGIEWIASP